MISDKNQHRLAVYCGQMSKADHPIVVVVTSGDYALITFHSDGKVEKKGFTLGFMAFTWQMRK